MPGVRLRGDHAVPEDIVFLWRRGIPPHARNPYPWTGTFFSFSTSHVGKQQPGRPGLLPPPRLLAAGRALAGISQRDLAKAAGVSRASIARYESGVASMRTDSLGALVVALRDRRIQFVGESRDAELGLLLVKEPRGNGGTLIKAE